MLLNILLLALLLVAIVISVIYIFDPDFDFLETLWSLFIIGVSTIFTGLLLYLLCSFLQFSYADRGTEMVESSQIVALKGSDKTSGQFFLATGTMDEKPVVRYMTQDSEGGLKIKTKDFDNSTVYEIKDGSSPRMECNQEFLHPNWAIDEKDYINESVCKFYIPEGSVVAEYELSVN